MFDLEKSIADWRQRMLAAGITSVHVLDELESHLREEIERLARSGWSIGPAFEFAVQQIGKPGALKNEFKKVERPLMKKLAIILLGIFGVLVGTAMIMPALAKHNHLGVWSRDVVVPLTAGTAITLAGAGTAVLGFRRRKA